MDRATSDNSMNSNIRLFFLKKKVLFPHCTLDVTVKNSNITSNINAGTEIITLPVKNILNFLFLKSKIATLSEIINIEKTDKYTKLKLKGLSRVKIIKSSKFNVIKYNNISTSTDNLSEIVKELKLKAQQLIFLINVNESDRLIELLNYLIDSNQITDFIANYFILDFKSRMRIFIESDPDKRSSILLKKLDLLIEKIDGTRGIDGKEGIQRN